MIQVNRVFARDTWDARSGHGHGRRHAWDCLQSDWKGAARRDGHNLATPGKADTVETEKLSRFKDVRRESDLIAAWGITLWLGEPA